MGESMERSATAASPPPPSPSTSGESFKWVCWVIIIVLSSSIYWNSLEGDFVHDDVVSIVRNPDVRPYTPLSSLWWNDYWGTPMSSPLSHKSYRPLSVLTFRFNYWAAGGLSPFHFHATNILAHVSVSILMFNILVSILKMRIISSLIAASLFAVHPVHTEAVAGLTGRSDVASSLLMLSSFFLYSKMIKKEHEESSEFGLILSALTGCSAMLAKETGVTVLGINVFYDLYIHKNSIKWWLLVSKEEGSKCQSRLRRRITFMVALISLCLGGRLALNNGSLPRFSQQDNPAAYTACDLTRFYTYAFLPVFNCWLMICPYRLSYDWQMGSIPVGLCILVAEGMDRLCRGKVAKLVIVSFCLMLMSFCVKTWDQNFVWKSRAALFESGVKENPRNAKVHYNYANLLRDYGDTSKAVKHYEIAISLWPSYASAYNNLGAIYENSSLAEESFMRAIHANPQHNGAHFNLGVLYMRGERYKEAVEHFESSLSIDPFQLEALEYLGACYNILNKSEEAAALFHQLIHQIQPSQFNHNNFPIFLNQLGLTPNALSHFLVAVRKSSWDFHPGKKKLAYHLEEEEAFQQLSKRVLEKFDPALAVVYMKEAEAQAVAASEKEAAGGGKQVVDYARLPDQESDSFYKIHYAQLLMKLRRWSVAAKVIEDGLRLRRSGEDPNHPLSILLLAQIYEQLNRTVEAYTLLQSASEKLCPTQGNSYCSQLYSQLGNVMHSMGDFGSAANYYDMAIKLCKLCASSVQAHTNVGAIHHLMGNYEEAQSHYLSALRIEPKNQVVMSNMGKLEKISNIRSRSRSTPASTQNHFPSSWIHPNNSNTPPNRSHST